MVVQKTPRNKTPKGKNSQSMSERKVSFEFPGKKTPGKTPQKNNSSPVKKQATPMAKGKTTVQEFKGMKGNKVQQKKQPQGEEEDDDDDNDEEVDVFELVMDDIDMEEEDDGGDDEDEDDDEDKDDEEDDEVEEQKTTQKQNKSNSKLQKNVKTLVKNVEQNSKAKAPKIETKGKPITKRERDLKSLFVGNLPSDVTANELKGLSPDIDGVNMPSKRLGRPTRFAFLMFSSAAKAESNYKTLQNKKLRGKSLSIDFVREKRQNKPSVNILDKVPKKTYNLKRLYIPAVPLDATVADIAIHFPKAFLVTLSSSPVSGSAVINFREEDAAAEGFKLRKIEVNGRKLRVYHSLAAPPKKNKGPHKKRLGKPHRGARPPAKKMKIQKGKKDE